ncbi:MAG: DpnI domain-containing protein [Thermodesulfobacteriota bacterium]|nr:MAG: DpnI domain-containing protein [Thermodesulfobacteriota bacterium]
MDLYFDISKSRGYKSPSQIARVLTEDWGRRNLFCASCSRNSLVSSKDNTKVHDYACGCCGETYQLKSQRNPLGNKFVDSAYLPMIESIRENRAPNLLLLHYHPTERCAENLIIVPRFFLSESCIEARKPLSEFARRAGWVGCNIVLKQLPPDGRIPIIRDRQAMNKGLVRREFSRFRFLLEKRSELRGWTSDVLKVVRDLGEREFSLEQVYSREDELSRLHPHNSHIRAKIRQQLQLLRDKGVVKFLGNGRYGLL